MHLKTDRLILCEIQNTDDKGFFDLDSNPNVQFYLGGKTVDTIAAVQIWIKNTQQQYLDYGIGRWAVVDAKTNDLVGWAGLRWVKEERNGHTNFYDMGYRLREKYWGKGIATEATAAVLHYAFANMNLSEVFAICEIGNKAS
jgi:[ribosomal protein S5]-alanine N-acetyltransferase